MTTGDPVSWLLVEPGWVVVDSTGEKVGTVDVIVGDTGHDIFDGLAIVSGLLKKARYVPAEAIDTITEERIVLTLSHDEVERLGEYKG